MSSEPETQFTLKNWERPYFTQAGHDNLLYFIVYGEIQGDFNISGEKYRVLYMPQELQLQSFRIPEGIETVNQFRSGLFAKMLEDQHPELVQTVNQQEHCYIVQAIIPDKALLNDFRVIIGIVAYLLDSGCVAAFDPLAHKWWTPQEWHNKAFAPEEIDPYSHVNIHVSSEQNDTQWVHSHGMRKFGRPDLSIHHVTDEEIEPVLDMVNRFIGFMAAGGTIKEGQEIRMASLPEGMTCSHKGSFDNPDFNNVHVEISWPPLD